MNTTTAFLSVLAASVSGNARLHEKLGSSEATRAVDRCLKRIQRAVDACGGHVFQVGGGEALAAFGTAAAAVYAAVEMQQRIGDIPPVSGVKMTIRVGISCGPAAAPGAPAEDGCSREASRLASVAKSGQILAIGRLAQALPKALRAQAGETGLTLLNEAGENEAILEIPLFEPRDIHAADTGETESENAWLRLRYGGKTLILDDDARPFVDMGRDSGCDLVIRDSRASRHHATIRRIDGVVVLTDKSMNGTYVTIGEGPEQFVKHAECPLRGHGTLSFAASSSSPEADCAEFECL
ncbi:MAG: FHA domain-containing protein [Candidatus Accumulibacter sp.]|jgi:hypothetical protein|nr:FHA domain-containing protein [Accumulibacter sp.]